MSLVNMYEKLSVLFLSVLMLYTTSRFRLFFLQNEQGNMAVVLCRGHNSFLPDV